MTPADAVAWLQGKRSTVNMTPREPVETLEVRIAQADAAMVQQAYWVLKAAQEGLVPSAPPKTAQERRVRSLLRKLERARGTLAVISTWSTFRGGEMLVPGDVESACAKALKESDPGE